MLPPRGGWPPRPGVLPGPYRILCQCNILSGFGGHKCSLDHQSLVSMSADVRPRLQQKALHCLQSRQATRDTMLAAKEERKVQPVTALQPFMQHMREAFRKRVTLLIRVCSHESSNAAPRLSV